MVITMRKKTKTARYNRYIQFYRVNGYEMDDGGNLVPKWELFKKKWCFIKDIVNSGRESEESGANTATLRVRLALRYTTELEQAMCFSIGDVVYDIQSIGDPEGLRHETIIFGEAKSDGGRN